MALTKLPKNAIGTGAIDASKIEDGTLQAVEISGTISQDKIATGTIANNKLSNSTFTIRGTSRALGDSFSLGVNVDWQSVIVADGSTTTTGSAGKGYFINTTSAAHTFTLPISATRGDTIAIKDYAGTFASNKLTIARNGHNIQGVANNSLIGTNRASLVLVYADSTKGWLYAEEHNVADLSISFISATGGTITTSGNFKIHTFTGDGSFVVATVGNPAAGPTGSLVDYLVVAGGGGGGYAGGGGGAGGYRTTFPSPGCNIGSFPVTATTYPITVGAGGPAGAPVGPSPGGSGSNSIFSTITSTGGGGGRTGDSGLAGISGGSGGGASYIAGAGGPGAGGTGNTPPVSPPQGNPGGTGRTGSGGANSGDAYSSGGGGGISAPGGNATAPKSGDGGAGSTNLITGSSLTYAGGGGGAADTFRTPSGGNGIGGTGGGGNGGTGSPSSGSSGTANTGGGGGGGNDGGGAGGKGIVIIRYKFQ